MAPVASWLVEDLPFGKKLDRTFLSSEKLRDDLTERKVPYIYESAYVNRKEYFMGPYPVASTNQPAKGE